MKTRVEMNPYVHGYNEREQGRLVDQATTLTELLHHDTRYPQGCRVLEVGCGVGAQTVTLACQSPLAKIVSVDISKASLKIACERINAAGISNVSLQQADLFHLPFEANSFDHVFVCFVLEHLPAPQIALEKLKVILRPGGTITVIEGDHGSTYFHPESLSARHAIQCLIDLQARASGNSLIGRQLFPLLRSAGLKEVRVSPRMVYVDHNRPDLVDGFIHNTFTAMVTGVRTQALAAGLIDEATFDQGIRDLDRTGESDGTFCYTFFKAIGTK